jgi:hypothetical protein
VTTPGFYYVFDGGSQHNPPLTLCKGVTYMFDLTGVASAHPMEFRAMDGSQLLNLGRGSVVSYTVPTTAPFPASYDCIIHSFGNTITVQ